MGEGEVLRLPPLEEVEVEVAQEHLQKHHGTILMPQKVKLVSQSDGKSYAFLTNRGRWWRSWYISSSTTRMAALTWWRGRETPATNGGTP